MNVTTLVSPERVRGVGHKLLFLMFVLVAFQVVATPEESQSVARIGVFLVVPVAIAGLLARHRATLAWALIGMMMNLVFVR